MIAHTNLTVAKQFFQYILYTFDHLQLINILLDLHSSQSYWY